MKRIMIFILMSMPILANAQDVDTLYYNSNYQRISNKAFADIYRIVETTGIVPKQFRDYKNSGELYAEGFLLSLDNFNDKNSVFEGKLTQYHKNGNIAVEKNYSQGKIDGHVMYYTEMGNLYKIEEYKNGLLNGNVTEYYPNTENHKSITPYINDIIQGVVEDFNENGLLECTYSYEGNLKIGTYTENMVDSPYSGVFKLMTPDGNNDISISCNAMIKEYATKFTVWPWEKEIKLMTFSVNCYNKSDADVPCKIENVRIVLIKGKKMSENMFVAENDAIPLFSTIYEQHINRAWRELSHQAYVAAYGSSSQSSTNSTTTSNSSATSAKASAGVAVTNNDVAIGASASVKQSDVRQKVNQSTTTTTSHWNPSAEYDVFEAGKAEVEQKEVEYRKELNSVKKELRIGSFMCYAGHTEVKTIVANAEIKKFDSIQMSFDMNGTSYSVSFAIDEIDNRIIK